MRLSVLLMLVAVLVTTTLPHSHGSAVLISDMTMTVMVELSSRHPFCKMHTDRGDIQRMLLQSDQRRIRQVPRESVMELEEVCKNQGSYGHEFRGGLGFIYPGTKWCGPGTAAASYDDLGVHAREDRCCREHDMCPDVLNVGECRRGLCNTGTFTRSHCDCDARFRRCLQAANTETANTLGAIFYNVVQVTCFQERSPCSAHQRFANFFPYDSRSQPQCDIEFRRAELYVPPHAGNLIQKILAHPYGLTAQQTAYAAPRPLPATPAYAGRALDDAYATPVGSFKQNVDQFTRRLGVKLASVGLAAVNIFREIVQRPRVVWDSLKTPVSHELGEQHAPPAIAEGYYYRNPPSTFSSADSGGRYSAGAAPRPAYYYAPPPYSQNYWRR